MGWCSNSGGHLSGLSYQEIESWTRLVGLSLTPWEIESIHSLSGAYASMAIKAQDKDCKPPYEVESPEDRDKRINDLFFGKKK